MAPRWLDPILLLAERINRSRVGVRPIRRGGILGLEVTRYHGQPRQLADGTLVRDGAPIGRVHLLNDRIRPIAKVGWQREGWRVGEDDLIALAAWWSAQPAARRPLAFRATTIHGPLAARAGFELQARPQTPKARLDDWWMRWLLVHYGLAGRARLRRGHGPLESVDAWLSAASLVARYGRAGGPVRPRGPDAGT